MALTLHILFIFLKVTLWCIMIVFHSLAYFLRKITDGQLNALKYNDQQLIGSYHFPGLDFMPAHRINAVKKILIQEKWRGEIEKIIEFGAGSLELFKEIKHIIGVTDIMIIEDDETLLETYKSYIISKNTNKCMHKKLTSSLSIGSIGDPDSRATGAGAVLAIEIIQTLYPDVLDAVPYNIFGFIQPKLVIITTPNSEFNAVFPNLHGFRSEKHKFEWTRDQFESWAENICVRFPDYTVYFQGIGAGLDGTDHLGCCTQMAVFERKDFCYKKVDAEVPPNLRICSNKCEDNNLKKDTLQAHSWGICTYCSYAKQIRRWEYKNGTNLCNPWHLEEDKKSWLEYVANFGEFKIWNYKMLLWTEVSTSNDYWSIERQLLHKVENLLIEIEDDQHIYADQNNPKYMKIPLKRLISNQHGQYTTIVEIAKILHTANYVIEEREIDETGKKQLCIIRPRMRQQAGSSTSSDNSEETDDNVWNIEGGEQANEASSQEEQPSQNEVNRIIDNILLHIDNRPEGDVIPSQQQIQEEPKEYNYRESTSDNRLLSRIRVECDKARSSTINIVNNDASTSRRYKNEKTFLNNKEITELKTFVKAETKNLRQKNVPIDENEDSAYKRAKTGEHKLKQTNIKDAIIKINSTNESKCNNRKEPVAGTSKAKKRPRIKKLETEEECIREDIKTLTQCIVYNSLNRVQSSQNDLEVPPNIIPLPPIESPVAPQPAVISLVGRPLIEKVIEECASVAEENPIIDDESALESEKCGNVVMLSTIPNLPSNNSIENIDGDTSTPCSQTAESIDLSLNYASVEALFDPNSETDMLEEVDMPQTEEPSQPPSETATINIETPLLGPQNVVVIGVRVNPDSVESIAMPQNPEPFPNWLLQLLGANAEETEVHDEPHFYCQGDGIGVHPSIVEVDIEEEISSSESSSTSDDLAENTISENDLSQFVDDIPFEDIPNHNENEIIQDTFSGLLTATAANINETINTPNDSADEFFDTIDDDLLPCHKCPCPNNPTGSFDNMHSIGQSGINSIQRNMTELAAPAAGSSTINNDIATNQPTSSRKKSESEVEHKESDHNVKNNTENSDDTPETFKDVQET